jgi:hypothetical protein
MGIAVVAMAFDETLNNGGTALKLAFQRAQSAKIAQKLTKDKKGNVLRKKGDVYLVDCNVTGSGEGTSKEPKFPLMTFFATTVFPEIEKLVKKGGRFEGYTPVIQGDNAGPHNDATFSRYVTDHCKKVGWLWEPQGPQMPHMNVLDLAVFPCMSRRHSHESRSLHGTRVLKEDEIWESAVKVWNDLPSSKIANSFVLANRIARKIEETKGGNEFLAGKKGGLSSGIRRDFVATEFGNRRRDGAKLMFEGPPAQIPTDAPFAKDEDGGVTM